MKILVVAPHPDDEILGCGGAIARHTAVDDEVFVCIMTCGHPPVFDDSIMKQNSWPHTLYPEIRKAHALLGIKDTFYLDLPAAAMETVSRYEINGKVMRLVNELEPDIVYIPHFGDMQKDHALTAEAVMVAVRPKYGHIVQAVYAYETLSETEWNIPHSANAFIPNTFVDISDHLEKKLEAMSCYQSQLAEFPNPRSLEAVRSLAKLRGTTSGFEAAEAFALIREYRR